MTNCRAQKSTPPRKPIPFSKEFYARAMPAASAASATPQDAELGLRLISEDASKKPRTKGPFWRIFLRVFGIGA
jgi:hypothetical protein